MNFAYPIAFAGLLLAAPVVVFYILKIRRRRVPVSTSIFWRQIFDEKQPRSLWQTLRHWLSLAAQLLLLALLVGALADPYLPGELLSAQRIVLVVDNSASMNATDESPTRLAAAKRAGVQSIAALRLRDEMAIVAAGTEPQVVCGLTGHAKTLRERLAAIPATDGPTRLDEAVTLARRLLADHPRGRVVVLSDGCAESVGKLSKMPAVEWRRVGQRTSNVGITRWQVRRSLLDPLSYEILVEVFNASDEPVECRLEIDLNDRPVDVLPLKLTPGQVWSEVLEKSASDGGRLIARIRHDDGLAADNVAVALLPKRERQRVVLVTAGNHFLRKAIEANPLVDLIVLDKPPSTFDRATVYFFHRIVPTTMPAAPSFVIDPATDGDLWKVGEKLANPIVTKQNADSPLMRHVRLDNVLMPDARQLQFAPEPKRDTLVEAVTGDPLLASFDRPQGRVLVLTVNLDAGDLTFRTVFPILVTNALAWFAGPAGELHESLATGATAPIEFPASAAVSDSWHLRSPHGDVRPLPTGVKSTMAGPLDQAGVWIVQRSTMPDVAPIVLRELACNMANRQESDLRAPTDLAPAPTTAGIGSGWLTGPIWFYLAAIAWLLMAVEWWLYQRRWLG